MAISSDLFLAILALDSYHRGYDPGIIVTGDRLGNAQIGVSSNILGEQRTKSASFYAQAYTWNGKTIISYRGTDNTSPLSSASDIWNGWTLGAGFSNASQGGLAREFYEHAQVMNKSVFDPAGSNVILTGHSLGAGLAGYISALAAQER